MGKLMPTISGSAGGGRDFFFEALRMCAVSRLQDRGAFLLKRVGLSEVHRSRGHEADAGVRMLMVVPVKELA